MNTYLTGINAEKLAIDYFRQREFSIIATRYQTKFGEVDLIVSKDRNLSFVEVKARLTLEQAIYSLTRRQQLRIMEAAQYFLVNRPQFEKYNLSFDLFAVDHQGLVCHYLNAWGE